MKAPTSMKGPPLRVRFQRPPIRRGKPYSLLNSSNLRLGIKREDYALTAGRRPVYSQYDLDRLAGLCTRDGRLPPLAQRCKNLFQLPPVRGSEGFVYLGFGKGPGITRSENLFFATWLPNSQPRSFQDGTSLRAL